MPINQNTLAEEVAKREGKLVALKIGQVKEVVRLTLEELSRHSDEEILSLIGKKRKVLGTSH